ncbi:Potassium channel KOR1 [Escovopsis weberi]|uniref:Potassium channel KOR1 n=1 Tax=Escovopsis weberi TaxID=150374 RepID=A0A0M8N3I3_ESCWE|nr:Potassium channel KOR1 [Escovopsis weberi]
MEPHHGLDLTNTAQIRDWRSIVTLIVFVLTNINVLFPFHISIHIPRKLSDLVLDALAAVRIIRLKQHSHLSQDGTANGTTGPGPFVRLNFPMNFVTAPLIADLFLLAISAIGRKEVHDGTLGADHISPIDIMAFFITLAYIAISIDASGLIRYLALKVLQLGGQAGHRLFFYLYVFFFILGSFIGNDPIILSGTAFLAYMTRVSSNIAHPRAWIHTQFAIANIASAILVSSNPTNLVLAGAFEIKFIHYTANMIVPVVVTAALLFPFLLYVVFREGTLIPRSIEMHSLPQEALARKPVNPNIPYARAFDRDEGSLPGSKTEILSLEEIMNPFLDKRGAVFAVLLSLPFALVPFAFCMFVLVQGLVSKGWVAVFAHGWDQWVRKTGTVGAVGGMGFLSVVLSNFAGTNIGTTILLSRVIQSWLAIHKYQGTFVSERNFWATVYSMALGVNYGAFSAAPIEVWRHQREESRHHLNPQLPEDNVLSRLFIRGVKAFPETPFLTYLGFLLALGANPNVICDRGLAPIHVTVSMRPAWQHFSALSSINGRVGCGQLLWNEQVAMTIGKLLRHGADPNLQSQIIWRHRCGHACWQSLDCQHRGQRPLHYAAASGNAHAITLFLREGADRDLPDNEGYIPFYQAMAQGHDLVGFLLLLGRGNPGPFVSSLQQSSPLHIACRFARHDMVYKLLSWNADPNARDSLGRTPLHEALLQDIPSLRYSIVKTLNYLSKAGADIGAVTSSGQSAHHLGRTHPIDEVRQLFQSVDRHELLAMYAASSCFWRDVRGAFGRYLYHPLEDMCIMSTIGSGISSVSLAQSTDSSRSAKVPVKKAAKKSHKKEAAQKASPRPSFGDLPPLVAGGPSPKSQHKSKSALFWANLKLNKSAPTRPQGAATDEKSTRPRMSRMESVGSTMTMTAESSTSVQATDSRQRPRKKKWVRLDV